MLLKSLQGLLSGTQQARIESADIQCHAIVDTDSKVSAVECLRQMRIELVQQFVAVSKGDFGAGFKVIDQLLRRVHQLLFSRMGNYVHDRRMNLAEQQRPEVGFTDMRGKMAAFSPVMYHIFGGLPLRLLLKPERLGLTEQHRLTLAQAILHKYLQKKPVTFAEITLQTQAAMLNQRL